jgi:vancomycin resistance protein YoaR
VTPLASFTLSPARLWHAAFGADDVAPALTVDDAAMDKQIDKIAGAVDKAPVDGAVAFVDGSATSTAPRDGTAVDQAKARSTLTHHWLTATGPIVLPTRTVHADVGTQGTQQAMVMAGTVTSAPVDVVVGSKHVSLPGDVVAKAASFVPDGSALSLKLDGDALRADVLARSAKLLTPAKNASFAFVKGKPTIKAGANGTQLDANALASAVATAAAKTGARSATVSLTSVPPSTTTDELTSLGVTKVVSEFATPLTNEPVRTKNLQVGAKKITGVVVKPGATFSMLDALAPITAAGGYAKAHMIENGQFVEATGGGLSQVATTTYNAAYFAGLDIVTHKPHSYWFSRYPEGREATLAVPSIDMKFSNDTPTGIAIRAWVGGGKLHVQLWGTPYYTVASTTSPRQDVVQPKTVDDPSTSCIADAGGSPGFLVNVRRVVSRDGQVVKDETNSWRYLPENKVVCTGKTKDKQ